MSARFPDFFLDLEPDGGSAPPRRREDHLRDEDAGPGWRLVTDRPASAPTGLTEVLHGGVRYLAVGEPLAYRGRPAPPATCLAAFAADAESGEDAPAQLAGRWAVLALDERRQRVRVWTDRCGTWHVYVLGGTSDADPVRALGTFSPALHARSRRRLDWRGLAGFFAHGFFPGDSTHYDDVRVLRPGTRTEVDLRSRRLRGVRYLPWQHAPRGGLSRAQAADEFRERFDAVLRRHAAGVTLALPISGGLDSRCTVASLAVPAGAPPSTLRAYSYGYSSDSIELRIAREVAAARGLPLSTFVIGAYLDERLDDALAATEGFVDLTQSRQVSIAAQLGASAAHVMAAHWGDVWLDDMGLLGADAGVDVAAHASKKFRKSGSAWLLRHVVGARAGAPVEAVLGELVADELRPLAHIEDPDFRLKLLKTEQWSFRWTMTSMRTFQLGAFPRLPFYEPELVDFFCTLPSELVAERLLQVEYLRRAAPDLARVEWQAFGSHLFDYPRVNPNPLWKRAGRRAWRTLRGQRVLERNWEVQFFRGDEPTRLFRRLVEPGLRLHELVPRAEVLALVEAFRKERSAALGYTVSALLTFAAWLETQP